MHLSLTAFAADPDQLLGKQHYEVMFGFRLGGIRRQSKVRSFGAATLHRWHTFRWREPGYAGMFGVHSAADR